jgi:hypothetical protein
MCSDLESYQPVFLAVEIKLTKGKGIVISKLS